MILVVDRYLLTAENNTLVVSGVQLVALIDQNGTVDYDIIDQNVSDSDLFRLRFLNIL